MNLISLISWISLRHSWNIGSSSAVDTDFILPMLLAIICEFGIGFGDKKIRLFKWVFILIVHS
jgi:hypothetical protein